MDLIFCKSKWDLWEAPLETFVRRCRDDGFGATEIWLEASGATAREAVAVHRAYGLKFVGQIYLVGDTVDAQMESLERQAALIVEAEPILVNCHAGKDWFSVDDNLRILSRIVTLTAETGVEFAVETHRGRPTYSAVETRRWLERLPELRLTADFSHWMVVHESDLSDQEETLSLAIERARHVHARVGYEEGPQVPDPRAPEWRGHVDRHIAIWKRIVAHNRRLGRDFLTITAEFGPPNYMHTIPFTNEPVADVWEVNVAMKDLLQEALRV